MACGEGPANVLINTRSYNPYAAASDQSLPVSSILSLPEIGRRVVSFVGGRDVVFVVVVIVNYLNKLPKLNCGTMKLLLQYQ